MARKRKLEEDDGPPGVPKAPYGAGTALKSLVTVLRSRIYIFSVPASALVYSNFVSGSGFSPRRTAAFWI